MPLNAIKRVLDIPRSVWIALGSVLLLILLILIYPFQISVVPAWPLQVVDDTNQPVAGINVTEHWQHYMLESEGHEELRTSDANGRVSFPERTIRASLIRRALAWADKFDETGVNARKDRYASVVVWGSRNHLTTTAVHQMDTLPKETIVVERVSASYSRLTLNKNLFSEFGINSLE